jgi:hypothetical protein
MWELIFPGNGARKIFVASDGASPLGTPRGRCDEYSSKIFPSIKKPRYVDLGEERQTTKGDAC